MKFFAFSLLVVLLFSIFAGCSKTTDSSLLEKFSQIDGCISSKQCGEAFYLLKQTEKKISGAKNYLGVIKRALELSKDEWAEKEIFKTLELYPNNLEVQAVYTHLLLRTNRIDEALLVGEKLQGTDYGSLYAEAVILQRKLKQQNMAFWMQDEFSSVYQDLYRTTENEQFLINNALICLAKGDYQTAFSYHPNKMSLYDNALFWALVSYDSQNWSVALTDASYQLDTVQSKLIIADSYLKIGDLQKAFEMWMNLINNYPSASVPAYLNVVKMYREENDLIEVYKYLSLALNQFPESVPVLTEWGDYAILSSQQYKEDSMEQILRSGGVKTLAMEGRDAIPIVNTIDVINRMTGILKNKKDIDLQLTCTKLLWATASVVGEKRCSDMWLILEENSNELNGMYDSNLSKYAMWLFLDNGLYSDSEQLLKNLKSEKNTDVSVGNELEAWLACVKGEYKKAVSLYETLPGLEPIKEYSTATFESYNDSKELISSYSALLNLGALYVANSQKMQAYALYEKGLSNTQNDLIVAELYYRIARIQLAQGNRSKALYNLQCCLKKNPAHNRARLFLKKLSK